MKEIMVYGDTLPEAYHLALRYLYAYGEEVQCPDYNTAQTELSMTMVVRDPLREPMISALFIGGPADLEKYKQEMLDGIMDFEVDAGKWAYTYHRRMIMAGALWQDQIQFVIDELKRNPDSRRAVIDVRDADQDMYSDDPACFCRGTKIDTPNGKVDVSELKDGDEVYAYDFERDSICRAKISNSFSKKARIVGVTTDMANIRVSENQLIDTERGWVEAKNLKPTDRVRYYPTMPSNNTFWHLVGCLCGDGWIPTPTPKRHSDGSKCGVQKTIGWAINPYSCEETIKEFLQEFTKNTLRIREKVVNSKTVSGNYVSKKIEFNDFLLYDKLIKYVPCGRKTSGVNFLLKADEMSNQEIVEFLTGLFSSEGSLAKCRERGLSIQIGMNWKECILEVSKMLDKLGVQHRVYVHDKTYQIALYSYEALQQFFKSGIDFRFDSRKQVKYEIYKKKYELMERFNVKVSLDMGYTFNANSAFIPIREINYEEYEDTVYDFTVDHKDHAIIANNIVSHNCLQSLQFLIRNGKLALKVLFRSNDACKATFMNAFALIMLQKKVADELGIEVGQYVHRANSFHCYQKDFPMLKGYHTRIMLSSKEDIMFNYAGDWDEMMAEARPKIEKLVNELKEKEYAQLTLSNW